MFPNPLFSVFLKQPVLIQKGKDRLFCFASPFSVTEDSMASLLLRSQVVNPEADLFMLVYCNFRQEVTFGEAMSPPLSEGAFFLFFKFFFFFFLMWTIFKVFIEFVTTLLLFYVLVFWPRGT